MSPRGWVIRPGSGGVARGKSLLGTLFLVLFLFASVVRSGHAHGGGAGTGGHKVLSPLSSQSHSTDLGLSPSELDRLAVDDDALNEILEDCPVVQMLNNHKSSSSAKDSASSSSSFFSTERLFSTLFPSTPAINAILATLYISGPPNLLLALCPPNIDPNSLNTMVAFAVGGLLGDTFFHLLPEIFLGEGGGKGEKMRFVVVDPNRNLLLGVAIMVGFVAFFGLDKGFRILAGGEDDDDHGGHGHSHAHGHAHSHAGRAVKSEADAVAAAAASGLESVPDAGDAKPRSRKNRNKKKELDAAGIDTPTAAAEDTAAALPSAAKKPLPDTAGASAPGIRHTSYLNLLADFTHNITDGLALGSAFYASPTLGATTTMAVFFHEIPHEVGDFALLIRDGCSKREAMGLQFVTAVGAMLGTLLSIGVNELGKAGASGAGVGVGAGAGGAGGSGVGFFGTNLCWGDMLLPFTAGTFLYVGTVGVIPGMLKAGPGGSRVAELGRMGTQFGAMAVGAAIMLAISWS